MRASSTVGKNGCVLLRLLRSKLPELLPYPSRHNSWEELLAAALVESAQKVMKHAKNNGLEPLRWGDVNRVYTSHPFSQAVPWLGRLLAVPASELASCDLCVRCDSHRRCQRAPGGYAGQGGEWLFPYAWRPIRPSPLPHYRDQQLA